MGQWTLHVIEKHRYFVAKSLCNKAGFIDNTTDHIIAIDQDTIYFIGAHEAITHVYVCYLTRVTYGSHASSHSYAILVKSRVWVIFRVGWHYQIQITFSRMWKCYQTAHFFAQNNVWTKKTFGWYLTSRKCYQMHSEILLATKTPYKYLRSDQWWKW